MVLAALVAAPAFAEEPLVLLQKMAEGARTLNYSGTFIYRSGQRVDTSRIVHAVRDGTEVERIEALDGSPREVLRSGTEVKCFFPEEKLLIVENRVSGRGFPALLPQGLGSLPEYYTIRGGETVRVAGLQSRVVRLEPRDGMRFGHELWMDKASGLLLKANLIGDRGDTLETFAFTQVAIGGPVDHRMLDRQFHDPQLRVQNVRTAEVRPEDLGWQFRNVLPGFRKVSAMKRQSAPDRPEGLHVVFTDGLASISVFIEPGVPGGHAEPLASAGPVNIYRRQLGDHRVVVMGEVPTLAVKRLGDGIEPRRR